MRTYGCVAMQVLPKRLGPAKGLIFVAHSEPKMAKKRKDEYYQKVKWQLMCQFNFEGKLLNGCNIAQSPTPS
jgi:hypothetical protein